MTRKAFQGAFGGVADGYVAKLNPQGTGLEYATYLGGSDFDIAGGVRVDPEGDAHIPGITSSSDFPVTANAFQAAYAGGPADAFIVTLNRRGSRLRFSSFLGGSGDDGSAGAGEWLDEEGNFYVPGFTDSQDFPVIAGAFQSANAGGYDVFLVKIAPRREEADEDDDDDEEVRRAPPAIAPAVGGQRSSRPSRAALRWRAP